MSTDSLVSAFRELISPLTSAMYLDIPREFKIFLLFLCLVSVTVSLNYDELEQFGVSCPPRDTCRNRTGADAVNESTCECDPSCIERGTCCIDSPYTEINLTHPRECIPVPHRNTGCHESYGMWTVTKCSPKWNGSSDVKELCEGDALTIGNPLMLVAASSPTTGLTYRNYFCAVCSEDNDDAVLWNVTLKTEEYISSLGFCEGGVAQDLTYKKDTGEWGYWNHFAQREAIFVPVTIIIDKLFPPFDDAAYHCLKDVVWTCDDNWRKDTVRAKCEAYMALVQGPLEYMWHGYGRRLFRNVHCAICNYVTLSDQFTCAAYYVKGMSVACGPEQGTGITRLMGHKMVPEECREEGKKFTGGINECRPVIYREKKV